MIKDTDWYKPGMMKYCVVANIVDERVDEEGILRHGTASFPAGRKVYISKQIYGNQVNVFGINRFKRPTYDYVHLNELRNIHATRTFSKSAIIHMTDDIIDLIANTWFGYKVEDKIAAELYAQILNEAIAGQPERLNIFMNDFWSHQSEYLDASWGVQGTRRCPIPDLLTLIGIEEKKRKKM